VSGWELSLVKGIVELHGGEVTAASEGPGDGSEFTIRLPLDQTRAAAPTPEPETADDRISRRILIIEDNPVGARSMRMLLEQMGHTVEVAYNGMDGMDGIEAARRFRPDVVLCDIGLPQLDGYALAQTLRQKVGLEGSFLIGVSGYAQDERRAAEAGFNAHLLKPVDFNEVERLLAKLHL
jgi:two-component system CheB/CheR fusion protein